MPIAAQPTPSSPSSPCRVDTGGAARIKKRKLVMSRDGKDEDAKVEMFFALIKNARDLRASLVPVIGEHEQKTKTADKDQPRTAPIWQPSFKLEDFVLEVLSTSDPTKEASSSKTKKRNGGNEKRGIDIDLNLSLKQLAEDEG
ncbi:hypothetical protein AKJ16_DCAP18430 [Drosera capensis]